jgi:3-hydroxymyristoyl/3-hydroxydecanoyl-(acyl carrier protein) dehydratase
MRWDLIDRFEVLKKGVYAKAVKSFDGREDFFAEHDPGRPRVPEPLFLEMIAQTGGVLLGLGIDFKKEVILAKIEGARFAAPAVPPCEFTVEARIEEEREEGAWISGSVKQKDKQVAQARILLVTMDTLTGVGGRSIVFNDHFLKHYDIDHIAKRSEGVKV